MATVYRNYGTINDMSEQDNEVRVTSRRQVYQATHEGENRLPFMYRSFISFTYGGKHIEDFNLIATFSGDRMQKKGYADFNDITSSYSNLDGQAFWKSHYTTNSLTFNLSTDGIEQQLLDDFMFWFHAGEAKELILSEHPNRAIMARVQSPPDLNLLPFEHDAIINISGSEYATKTTLYKGDITLTFVMDEPHWYAVQNLLGREDSELNRYIDEWVDANGNTVDIFASQDALKILLEDGIPLGSMIDNNMLLGNGLFANVENQINTLIWSVPEDEIIWDEGEPSGEGARIYGEITEYDYAHNSKYAVVSEDYTPLKIEADEWLSFDVREVDSEVEGAPLRDEIEDEAIRSEENMTLQFSGKLAYHHTHLDYWPCLYNGKVAGPIVDISGKGLAALPPTGGGYFFYSGTAPSPTIISFTILPTFDRYGYFNAIANSISQSDKTCNTITIESKDQQKLQFTTPNLFTSYNTALKILYENVSSGVDRVTVREQLVQNVRHAAVRAWAIALVNTSAVSFSLTQEEVEEGMRAFLLNDQDALTPISFVFNSKTGEAFGEFQYRLADSNTLVQVKEDVGDMLRSNNVFVMERNYPTVGGKVVKWNDTVPGGKSYSHRITHDLAQSLTNFQIYYRNMYL